VSFHPERRPATSYQAFIDPSEQFINTVHDELVARMGPVDARIHFAKDRPTLLVLCGLQGQGKTTTAATELALTLREQGRKPMLVAADLQPPVSTPRRGNRAAGGRERPVTFHHSRRGPLTTTRTR
jgi:signal recognition particle GTPase